MEPEADSPEPPKALRRYIGEYRDRRTQSKYAQGLVFANKFLADRIADPKDHVSLSSVSRGFRHMFSHQEPRGEYDYNKVIPAVIPRPLETRIQKPGKNYQSKSGKLTPLPSARERKIKQRVIQRRAADPDRPSTLESRINNITRPLAIKWVENTPALAMGMWDASSKFSPARARDELMRSPPHPNKDGKPGRSSATMRKFEGRGYEWGYNKGSKSDGFRGAGPFYKRTGRGK